MSPIFETDIDKANQKIADLTARREKLEAVAEAAKSLRNFTIGSKGLERLSDALFALEDK